MSEWREFFESLRWRGVVLAVAGLAGFVALCFVPLGSCSLKVTSTPTTTVPEFPVCVWDEGTGRYVSPTESTRPCVLDPAVTP